MEKIKEFFAGFKRGQKLFGETIAAVVNSLLLTFVYIIGVGLTSLFVKMAGKSFLNKKLDASAKSYWESMSPAPKKKEEYYKQF